MATHPLQHIEFQASNLKCFSETGSGFFNFEPITVVVGRNNSGKSSIIDFLESISGGQKNQLLNERLRRGNANGFLTMRMKLDEHPVAVNYFKSSGASRGVTHETYLSYFQQRYLAFRVENGPNISLDLDRSDPGPYIMRNPDQWKNSFITDILNPLCNTRFSRVSAERDIRPEPQNATLHVTNSGEGVTNLLRAFLLEDRLDVSRVEVDLLHDLNEIFSGDSKFERILCRQDIQSQNWEVFLREANKGDVRLSQSGSSLKTIFLILSYFILLPQAGSRFLDNAILAIEEPENNLHPALLRRLLEYLARKRMELSATLILSTHSPVCIDWASRRDDSTVVHVRTTTNGSVCSNAFDHNQRTTILDDLDVRGSDLLQSNGIVWVEGPSDRIYLRKWIELHTDGLLKEGVHYSFLYYGGRILSHFDAANPQELTHRVSLLTVNRNAAVIMDSDRHPGTGKRKPRMRLNETKRRMIEEVEQVAGFSWVTHGREIENYVPDTTWQLVISDKEGPTGLAGTCQFKTSNGYVDIPELKELSAFRGNKVDLAHAACERFTKTDLNYLDLQEQVKELCNHIRKWNGLALEG